MNLYSKEELLNKLDKLKIIRNSNTITTTYNGRVLKTADVSKIYEVFDIVQYIKDKIDTIEKNFIITKYNLVIKGGIQYLELFSDKIEINGRAYEKSFYILNSTDRSRKLNFDIGLKCLSENFSIIFSTEGGFTKRHLKGITQIANDNGVSVSDETFNNQIDLIERLDGHMVKYSEVKKIILGDKLKTPDVNKEKMRNFNYKLRFYSYIKFTTEQYAELSNYRNTEVKNDFYIPAFKVLELYMKIFIHQDSHIVRVETDRILNITQSMIRNKVLENLFN